MGCAGSFCIRSTLHWHNGDKVETVQLQQVSLALLALTGPA
jgi:MarR-like DNA-binding transcriptional regulator SgrR of sgrS sRNA